MIEQTTGTRPPHDRDQPARASGTPPRVDKPPYEREVIVERRTIDYGWWTPVSAGDEGGTGR